MYLKVKRRFPTQKKTHSMFSVFIWLKVTGAKEYDLSKIYGS